MEATNELNTVSDNIGDYVLIKNIQCNITELIHNLQFFNKIISESTIDLIIPEYVKKGYIILHSYHFSKIHHQIKTIAFGNIMTEENTFSY